MFNTITLVVSMFIVLSTPAAWAQASRFTPADAGGLELGPAPLQPGEPLAPSVRGGGRSPADVAWGIRSPGNSLVYFTLSDPGEWTTVGDTGITDFVNSIEFAGTDFSVLYALGTFQPVALHAVSTANGAATYIGTVSGVAEPYLTGMAWSPTDATMYVVSTDAVESYLYRIDLATAMATLIGAMHTPAAISLAINCQAAAYCHDLDTNTLLSVDLRTGVATTIGPLGFDANHGQGLDFDDDSGELYMTAVSAGTGANHLRRVNTSTGEATIVGTLTAQLGSLAIATACTAGVTYQGRLQWQGAPLSAPVDFRFRLFDAEFGGATLGETVDVAAVSVTDGLFAVFLDFAYPFGAAETWLEVAVAHPAGSGSYTTLSPRQFVGSAPRAHFSARSDFAANTTWQGLQSIPAGFADGIDDVGPGDGHSLDASDGSPVDVVFVDAAGLVGVGTTAPTDQLTVAGVVRSTVGGFELPDGTIIDAASDYGDVTAVTAGSGLTGGGAGGAVTLSASFGGTGAATTVARSDHYHSALAASDGVPAEAVKVGAAGNVGIGTTAPDTALHIATGTDASLASASGYLLLGSTAGENIVMDNDEIMARNNGTAASLYLNNDGGNVVIGPTIGYSTLHVEGAAGSSGLRVRFDNSTKLLVNDNGSTSIGASAVGPTNGLRVAGDCNVLGTLTKSGGSFKIDHPLDPENYYLYHSFVESPDMMNIYNGNVVTDEQGYAVVALPAWFEALNRDFRYQLTAIGSFSRAMVAEEVRDGAFVIRTEEPYVKISWQVTGIRQDAWAEHNRVRVEVEKEPEARGRYLHPELFGRAARDGISAAAEPDGCETDSP